MTAMSRKFYVNLATKYKGYKPSKGTPAYAMWLTLMVATTNVIAEGNPAFDKQRFLVACGLDEHEAMATAGALA